jgi:hypothetical protein
MKMKINKKQSISSFRFQIDTGEELLQYSGAVSLWRNSTGQLHTEYNAPWAMVVTWSGHVEGETGNVSVFPRFLFPDDFWGQFGSCMWVYGKKI